MWFTFSIMFFFQAEDGIRDLVRSRGLGDVYKRQIPNNRMGTTDEVAYPVLFLSSPMASYISGETLYAVSYTHLTLPTSDLV